MAIAGLFDGVGYEYAALAGPHSLLFTAGACPLDEDGAVVAPGDAVAQAERTVGNLDLILRAHGARFDDLVRTTIYVVGDRDALAAVWSTVATALSPARPPSTLLGVTGLGYPAQLVEIDAIAALARK